MRMRRLGSWDPLLTIAAMLTSVTVAGQTSISSRTVPRTPWGDPDLQGVYTNKDENGIPLERPKQFDGKTIAEVKSAGFDEVVRRRQQEGVERAPGIGGAETGAGPVHWYEYYGAK